MIYTSIYYFFIHFPYKKIVGITHLGLFCLGLALRFTDEIKSTLQPSQLNESFILPMMLVCLGMTFVFYFGFLTFLEKVLDDLYG